MTHPISRRSFVRISASGLGFGALPNILHAGQPARSFKLSLNESSLHRLITSKKVDHLDFAGLAKKKFGIDAVEYVSRYFGPAGPKETTLRETSKRAAEHRVRQILIEVDNAGELSAGDAKKRKAAVAEHTRWIDAAKTLGCHAISVAVSNSKMSDDDLKRATESLSDLCTHGTKQKILVLVSNRDGAASDPDWLIRLIKSVASDCCGSMPCFSPFTSANPYAGMKQLMPFAKGVCATADEFDKNGAEKTIDYSRMMQVVLDSGYRGYVGIKYRGKKMDELSGIRAAAKLLEGVRKRQS